MLHHATFDPPDVVIDFDTTLTKVERTDDAGWEPCASGSRLLAGTLVPGTRLEILQWIGEGSMGQVFEALHLDIQRRVALKVLRATFETSPELCTAFSNEAKACARVESRFVVEVMDFGVLPDRRPFFVMELLGREDLHNSLKAGAMSLARALPILRQCCKALAAIHEAGLVHRDIKPKNVVLQREDGRADAVRVVDLGLAAEPGSAPKVSGTAPYMAPEQITGERFDGRVDIYALGCMAYVMLAKRPPFVGSLEQLLDAHKSSTPAPISALRPELPAALDPILRRCLEKSPARRWSSPHELEAALVELQLSLGIVTPWDDLPMPQVDDEHRERLSQAMARRNRRSWWMVSVGLGATLLLGGVVGNLSASRADAATRIEAPPVTVDDSRIEQLTNDTRLAASKAYWVYSPPSGQATALHWIGVLEAQEGPLAAPAQARATELRGEIADTLTRLGDRYWNEQHGRGFALEFYALALVFVPDLHEVRERSPLTPTQLSDLIDRAKRGQFTDAELRAGTLMEALADQDEERRRARVVLLVATGNGTGPWHTNDELIELVGGEVASSAAAQGALESEQNTKARAVTPQRSDGAAAAALIPRAEAATLRGQRAEARRLFNEALELDRTSVDALTGLAELHFESGQYSRALGFARKAVQLRPQQGELHILVGDCYLKSMRYADARAAYRSAAKLDDEVAAGRLAKLDALLE